MSVNGIISSEPVHTEDRIKFTLTLDETHRQLFCVTELDFGQFNPVNQGDHVSLTGTMVQESFEGKDGYFCADSINPVLKGGRRVLSHS